MPARWMGNFHSPVPIRCRGALHFYSARDADTDKLGVVVTAPRLPRAEARARLSSLVRSHRLVAGEAVPDVLAEAVDADPPWIALDCDAIADQEALSDFVRQGAEKPDFVLASVVGKTVMETLARTHGIQDPETRRPVVLGSLAAMNLLFAANGKMWIVGFGAGPLAGACVAPEVASGGTPSPGADVYALILFLRSQMELVRLPSAFRRVSAGASKVGDAKLVLLFLWSNLKILAGPPRARPSMSATLSQAREMWQLLGIEPDVGGFAAWVADAISIEPERLADAPESQDRQRIVVGLDAEWVETPNGMRHTLRARRPLRRLLLALMLAHRDRPGGVVGVEELLQAGWPGESPHPEAASNRIHVAISTLRKMGFGEALQRWDGGYRIDPGVQCRFQ
jgi:hypothetical protein